MNKKQIEEAIECGDVKAAWDAIVLYEKDCPKDPEIFEYKSLIAFMTGDNEAAVALAREAARLLPYDADAFYNYAEASEANSDIKEAVEYYLRARALAQNDAKYSFDIDLLDQKVKRLLELIEGISFDAELGYDVKEFYKYMESVCWEHRYSVFHSDISIIGSRYFDYRSCQPMHIAYSCSSKNSFTEGAPRDTGASCAELQRAITVTTKMDMELGGDYYVSIASERGNVLHITSDSEEKADITVFDNNQFYDLKFPKGKYTIASDIPVTYGPFVPIGHSTDRKKAVISIFIDGLSQYIINDSMKELMPNTYEFFKDSVICRNTYSTADWTLPAVMSASTGLSIASHKMIHPWKLRKLDLGSTMLAEYFMANGYNTTKIGGNWRIVPTYGYGRGFNRVMYQHQYCGFDPANKISEAIEQLYSMNDTDQFIWLEIGDLHLIADGIDMGPVISQLPVMENGELQGAFNSVKQEYDPIKIKYYKEKVKYVDRKLAALYQYLESNYSDDEMVVAVFSDHGQSFLLKEDDEFFHDKRSKVALMVRGNGLSGVSEEYISLCDYSEILCKMAGIPYNNEFTDSNLPRCFGGEREREYAITETIHPGDPYRIALHSKDYNFFLTSTEPVGEDCLVRLNEYTVRLEDKEGNLLNDEELKERLIRMSLDRIAPNLFYPKE